MRKALLVAMLALALAALTVGIALANNGPHGNYTLTTGKCAGCHRIHTALSDDGMLLKEDSVTDLCLSCHAGGVQTDVAHGLRTGDNARLNAGGFLALAAGPTTMVPASLHQVPGVTTDIAVQTTGGTVTSRHNVEGISATDPITGTAWGSGSGPTAPDVQGVLECTSCHNPHGSTNYRILNDNSGTNGWKWITDDRILAWGYVSSQGITVTTQVAATPSDGYNYAADYAANYTKGISDFCSSCHRSYLTKSGARTKGSLDGTSTYWPGTQDIGDGDGFQVRYRHTMERTTSTYGSGGTRPRMQPLRVAYDFTTSTTPNRLTCLTCHFAHGTAASAAGNGGDAYYTQTATGDSALMFYDGRGICRACHMGNR